MAILLNCRNCGTPFTSSVSAYKSLCDECDGTNERNRQEEDRWKALTVEEKLNELRNAVRSIQQQSEWDGMIG